MKLIKQKIIPISLISVNLSKSILRSLIFYYDFGFIRFICMGVLPFCRHAYQIHAYNQQRLEKDVRSLATRVTDGFEQPSGFWKPKPE